MLKKKRGREDAEIPMSSLADIAFLLLIFFLVVTTIDVDTGIGLILPPIPDENTEPPPVKERNLLNILVNAQGMVLIDEEPASLNIVKDRIKEFVDNNGADPDLSESPDDAIVSIKTTRQTPYNVYIDMLDEVMGAYAELRNQASMERFGVPFESFEDNSVEQEEIQELYPKKISIAEPDEG
ncbi:ExbD/TolR family protein [Rhodohalobacter sulfatireducens]|uniref:Biopolymer transporter ExbD n=1 Tax=Rhodohalobacter sulfatireducens TaxID=2911366 RepID=A0ABS9KBT6_9BACT|nr:biopolymer transporter ExbD [Rhodohalobacter sulfatireducens]MCG2588290.1 biopolymer transporter ExbD [Rhodohalobacter sulfatireducens]MDR9365742.1 biopolymer transporter ExbD [Balneolaceae bacterium]MDR9409459.1 biopolymer transporter ExbD [Balneolaceae bacterium]